MTANVEILLARLDGVRPSGKDSWRARCAACGGKSRDKVSITAAPDGRILLHAFCGCPAADVLQAVGLTLADLFPERLAPETPEDRRRARLLARQAGWGAALELLEFEARVVLIAGREIAADKALSDDDLQRLALALDRIESARSELRPVDLRSHVRGMSQRHEAMREGVPA